MPPNERTAAHQAWDQHAIGDTVTAIGRHHDGLCFWFARLKSIGLHWDSRHRGPTDKDCNLLALPEGYRLAGVGPDLLWTHYLEACCPTRHSHRLRHPVYNLNLDPGMFSLEYWPSAHDSLPSTERWVERAWKSNDGAISPSFLQLKEGQFVRTLAPSPICIQFHGTHLYKDDSVLGYWPLSSSDAVWDPGATIEPDCENPSRHFRS